jgi:hypothetical protein
VVVDRAARVCALSGVAETLLAVTERDAAGCPITELIAPVGDPPEDGPGMVALVRAVASGAQNEGRTRGVAAGATVAIRVGPCGPPRAALLVLGTAPAA